jgi:hypothetical protein
MSKYLDKTKLDNNRRLLNLKHSEVENALPEYFKEDFPNLIKLFDAYYDWLEEEGNPGNKINNLYKNRDATQVPEELLTYLEDELLLGQAYFGGFLNKREAIKFSNQLYRSKGTKYSIEQFFRGFFGADPQILYPKENIFLVGPDIDYNLDSINTSGQQIKQTAGELGSESQRFLTDDKKYQVLSVLIKSDIPIANWLETYKLFVHPAGAHIAGELVLELVNGNVIRSLRESGSGIPVGATFVSEPFTTGISSTMVGADITLIEQGDSGGIGMIRSEAGLHTDRVGSTPFSLLLGDSNKPALTYREIMTPNSLTMDDSDHVAAMFDQDSGASLLVFKTMDEGRYRTLFDSSSNSADSAHFPTGP